MITLLIGHRGVGKTTLLKRLEVVFAHQEDVICRDLDSEIETLHKRSIRSIFQEGGGEPEFRRLETQTFENLLAQHDSRKRLFVATGAGFEFNIPKGIHCVWVRRPTDAVGRIHLNRPKLSETAPMDEWRRRFKTRDNRYRHFAHEEIMLPECGLHDRILEEHFFTGSIKMLPYTLSLLPENLRAPEFLEKRRRWGLKWLELRNDLFTPEQIQDVLKAWPAERVLYSIRKQPYINPATLGVACDWATEMGPAPFPVQIQSLHKREESLTKTLAEFSKVSAPILKLAVEIRSMEELLEGHRWWRSAPDSRAFLPVSKDGRWQWYRQLYGPQMPVHFFREGGGTAPDQPYLWQTLTTLRWSRGFAAVLGSPIQHSWTPSFQREFMDNYSIPAVAIDINEAQWDTALPILRELGLRFAAVTSPLKKKALSVCRELTSEAKEFESVNTLAWTEAGWSGHCTDAFGATSLFRGEFPDKHPIVVWGGGGVKPVLQKILPKARFVAARAGEKLAEPVHLIWAVGRDREFIWPLPPVFIRSVVDLNYSEDSPGREIAQLAGAPYKSGEIMFIQQGFQQREFWKRFL